VALSDEQIERYSRQIIVPRMGGVGQERLLAARLVIAGEVVDLEPILAYLAGAGVGRISLILAGADAAACAPILARVRDLNRDVAVEVGSALPADASLLLAIAGSASALNAVGTLNGGRGGAPVIFARFDRPAKIALIPTSPPCIACADGNLLAPFSERADNAGFVAMVAAVESLKLIAGYAPAPKPRLIEFNGYEAVARELRPAPSAGGCGCESGEHR
jgi:hypothetical protein